MTKPAQESAITIIPVENGYLISEVDVSTSEQKKHVAKDVEDVVWLINKLLCESEDEARTEKPA